MILDRDEVPEERQVARLLKQILDGIAFLHSLNVAHLDIKVRFPNMFIYIYIYIRPLTFEERPRIRARCAEKGQKPKRLISLFLPAVLTNTGLFARYKYPLRCGPVENDHLPIRRGTCARARKNVDAAVTGGIFSAVHCS